MQSSIPAVFMRGGTSRGLYFKRPICQITETSGTIFFESLDRLIRGRWTALRYDVCYKSCILSPSERDDCDIDYLFAQLAVDEAKVDYADLRQYAGRRRTPCH